jgi:hypothetical protein
MKKIDSLKQVTFKTYLEFEKFLKENDGDITKVEETVLAYKILNIFYGLTISDIKKLSIEEVDEYLEGIFNAVHEPLTLHNTLTKDGIVYGLIPNFEKVKAGELIELDSLLAEEDWISIMSILYRPVIEGIDKKGNYMIEPYGEYSDTLFEDISAYDVLGCRNFFTKSFQILSQDTHISI